MEVLDDDEQNVSGVTYANLSHILRMLKFLDYDYRNSFEYRNVKIYGIFYAACIGCPIAIFGGIFTNILALVVLLRSRLWLKHEGYVYLAANFCANIGILTFCVASFWETFVFGRGRYYPPNTSNFMCKMWHFLMSIFFFASGWLTVALLFNVYLREHLIHRRCCGCPIFAAKYCTLFATKIIVGVIFGVLFVCGVPYLAVYELLYVECRVSGYLALDVTITIEVILMWALPFVFFLPIILLTTLCTKREGNSFGFSQMEERSPSDEQMKVMAVTLSSMTLFSQFVLVVIHRAHHLLSKHTGWFGGRTLDVPVIIELAFALSTAFQPILCFIILKALKQEFHSQLRRIRCCLRLCPSLDRDEDVVQLTTILDQEDPPSISEP